MRRSDETRYLKKNVKERGINIFRLVDASYHSFTKGIAKLIPSIHSFILASNFRSKQQGDAERRLSKMAPRESLKALADVSLSFELMLAEVRTRSFPNISELAKMYVKLRLL